MSRASDDLDPKGTAMITAPASSRLLFRWALLLFTITVVIGILNGTDLVSFDRNADLTHLHSGTLGWVTLSVLGAMLWIFDPDGADRSGGRWLAILSAAAVAFYVFGFWTGNPVLRPLTGSAALIPIGGGVVWAVRRSGGATRDVPKMGILLSLTSLALGGVLGILLGLQRTNVVDWLPAGLGEAHPQLLFGGYVFLAGGVLAEWLLVGDDDPKRQDRSGQVQVWLFFLAGLSLGVGLILDVSIMALLPVPAGVAAFGLILTRMRSGIRHARWARPSESRFAAAGIVWLVAGYLLLGYLFASYPDTPFPPRQGRAFTHAIFIGGMTNVLLGLIRRAGRGTMPPSLGQFIFWGLNGGVFVFWVGLIVDSSPLIRVGTPILGAALLAAIAWYVWALGSDEVAEPGKPAPIRADVSNEAEER